LKIWIDILTPKQLLFSEPIIEKLSKKHDLLCTSRDYDEVSKLAKIRNFDLILLENMEEVTKKLSLKPVLIEWENYLIKLKHFLQIL